MKTDNQPTNTPLTVKALQDVLEKVTSEKKRWQSDNLHLVRIVEEDEFLGLGAEFARYAAAKLGQVRLDKVSDAWNGWLLGLLLDLL